MPKMTGKIAALTLTAIMSLGAVGSAFAGESQWEKAHPRREAVNQRLHNQDRRINKEVREGEISKQQAHQLHREDHQIRQEERDMARQNGGHITGQERRTLNQQENGVSRQIGK